MIMPAKESHKTIGDVVTNQSMHPTNDNWYPSFDRGYGDEPKSFEDCECWECQIASPEERKKNSLWSWKEGGRVACFLTTYSSPQYPIPNSIFPNRSSDDYYMARVSFWGLDDFGLEKRFQFEEDARYFVCHLPSYISKEFLWDHGFEFC